MAKLGHMTKEKFCFGGEGKKNCRDRRREKRLRKEQRDRKEEKHYQIMEKKPKAEFMY